MHRIGVISDTHGLLRPEVAEVLQSCEVIFHGGDVNRQSVLNELKRIAPVYVVRGNNDKEWAEHIPETLNLDIFGLKVFMVHNKKFIPEDLGEADLIIYGHSHKYEERRQENQYYLNPGSCGPKRFHQEITMAVLTVEDGHVIRIEKVLLTGGTGRVNVSEH